VQPNQNLVEISDWLTKIIVGVGLVELHSIPSELGKLSYYLAQGLQPVPCAGGASSADSLISGQAAGLAILIFYFALGFLYGCVWTMIYFQRDLGPRLKKERRSQLTANSMNSAEAYINLNQFAEALATIGKAIENDPQNGFPVITKARILKRQAVLFKQADSPDRKRLLKQAIACVDQAIALLPDKDKAEPLYNKACYQALLDANRLKRDILENLKAAFRLNPALRESAEKDDDFLSLRNADSAWLKGLDELPES
jgi:tetratricopeptide (TPR) repeat protein